MRPKNKSQSAKETPENKTGGGPSQLQKEPNRAINLAQDGQSNSLKGRSIDEDRSARILNRFDIESLSAQNQSVATDQMVITTGGQNIKGAGATTGIERNLFYKVQDSTLNQEDLTDEEATQYMEENDFSQFTSQNLDPSNKLGVNPAVKVYNASEGEFDQKAGSTCFDDDDDGLPIVDEVEDHAP